MSILAALLPMDCLLCGGEAAVGFLCPSCADDLPRMPASCCPVCAEALPSPATDLPCGACLKEPPAFDRTISPFRYAFPMDKLVQELKFGHRLALAGLLARAMLAGERPAGELLLPVPLPAARLRERGFNQAVEIARPLAAALGLPLLSEACTRPVAAVPQASLPWKQRRRNIRHAFDCRVDLTGKSVIVVDDVMTTGATLNELARVLKAHGAREVSNWVAARTLRR